MTYTPDQMVAKYVELRDAQKELSKKHAEEMAPFNEGMEAIEAWLMNFFNATGQQSARTDFGTAYKQTVMSTSVADWSTVQRFVFGTALFRALAAVESGGREADALNAFLADPSLNFLTKAVSKEAVKEWMENHSGAEPPGVKTVHVTKVNVRRT